MGDKSGIEWTDASWNPVTGCDRVSPGFAGRFKKRGIPSYQNDGDPKTSGPGFGVTLHPDRLDQPLRWTKPRMIFVNSMSDLFHEEIPDEYIAQVFDAMRLAPQHTFQVLTKRPERMAELVPQLYNYLDYDILDYGDPLGYLPNVWLGVSIENRRFVDHAEVLRETPSAVRFISAEPLLGPLVEDQVKIADEDECEDEWSWSDGYEGPGLDLDSIDWLIVGGESGPSHRSVDPEWVRALRNFAYSSQTAFFFKQWGGHTPKSGGRELDGRTWDEMPETSQVATNV